MEPFYASGSFVRGLASFHMNSGVNPTDPTYKDMFKTVTWKIYQIIGNKAGNNNQATTKRLPQTGDTKDSTAIAGLGLLALASLLGFGKRQKRD